MGVSYPTRSKAGMGEISKQRQFNEKIYDGAVLYLFLWDKMDFEILI